MTDQVSSSRRLRCVVALVRAQIVHDRKREVTERHGRGKAMERLCGPFGEILLQPDTRGKSAPHFHATHAIGVCRSGGGTLFTQGQRWDHSTGVVVVINPFVTHWGRPSPEGLSYWLFYPDPRWLAGLPALRSAPAAFWFKAPVIDDQPLAAELSQAIHALAYEDCERPLKSAVDRLFARYAAAADIERECMWLNGSAAPEPMKASLGLSVAEQAAKSGLSRAYYSRSHRKRTGLSPLDYRRQARVLAAQVMIENGAALVDVALETGFADQAHMTRQFRQILGVTPATYRPAP